MKAPVCCHGVGQRGNYECRATSGSSRSGPTGDHTRCRCGRWDEALFWFTSAVQSRKARNIANDPRCTVATEDEQHPVVLNGEGEIRTLHAELAHVIELFNAKYGTDYAMDFVDPTKNATIRVRPMWAFGVDADDFIGSPTRWTFQ